MLSVKELLTQKTMPTWNDISLKLYKDFTVQYLLNRCFEYHLVNGTVICVQFKEWAMKHLWAIHYIDGTIDKNKMFRQIEEGLDIDCFMKDRRKRHKLLHYKDGVRMFACIYYIMKCGNLFYVNNGVLQNSRIKVNYIRSKIVSEKGVNVGMRLEAGVYVPLTILIDTAVNPYKTVEKLYPQKVFKLIIKEKERVVEEVYYNNYWKRKKKNKICKRDTRPACFNPNTYAHVR